jgi:hypothetical protein
VAGFWGRCAGETRRELSPTRLLHPSDVMDLTGSVLLWRVLALTTDGNPYLDQTDDVLATDGILAALMVLRIYFGAGRSLALLQEAEAAW